MAVQEDLEVHALEIPNERLPPDRYGFVKALEIPPSLSASARVASLKTTDSWRSSRALSDFANLGFCTACQPKRIFLGPDFVF